MKTIILHYQVIHYAKKCCNNTIRQKKYLSKPKDRTGFQKELKTPKRGIQTWVTKRTKHAKGMKRFGKNKNKTLIQEGNEYAFEGNDDKIDK